MAEAVGTELEYLVLFGAERYVSSYVNQGDVVLWGDVIEVGPVMAGRLRSNMRIDPQTNEPKPYFRDATPEEIEAHIHRLENLDPNEADPSLVGEAARMEAVGLGQVEAGELKEVDRREKQEEDLQPVRKRARRSRGKADKDD